jgi:repressor LexA
MSVRPTKKQREMLSFIDNFITGHGYGPSYREIMRGLGYKSVSTVATHIDNLIARGHLLKRTKSARSLEVVASEDEFDGGKVKPEQEKWLVQRIDAQFQQLESVNKPVQKRIDELYVLVGALKVLGLEDAARSFLPRLTDLKNK